jgi:hypothetical protein
MGLAVEIHLRESPLRERNNMPHPHYADSLAPAVVHPGRDCHVDHALRALAYELWEKAGRPEGADPAGKPWADHFWLLAEAALHNSAASAVEER